MKKELELTFLAATDGKIIAVTNEGYIGALDIDYSYIFRFYDTSKNAILHSMPNCVLQQYKEAQYFEYNTLLQSIVKQHPKNNISVLNTQLIDCHRPPTIGEIKFGHGATHYAEIPIQEWLNNKTGKLKMWIKSNQDNLRYYR